MLNHRLVAPLILLVFAIGAVVAGAQGGGNVYYSNIDIPQANQVINRQALVVHGWAFNCTQGGQQPYFLQLRLVAPNGTLTNVATHRYSPLYRPDVKAAYASWCAEMSSYTGYALVPVDWTQLPTGTFQLMVVGADAYGSTIAQMQILLQ